MSDFSLIACCEEHDTRSEKLTSDATTCSVVLRCAWADRFLLAQDIGGLRRPWPALSAWAKPPRGKVVSIVPDGGQYTEDGQECVYNEALVTVEYDSNVEETEEDEDSPELVITESIDPYTEFITLDYRKFRWGNVNGDPLTEAEAPGRPFHGLALVRQMSKWEPPLPIDLLSKINCINQDAYVSARLGLTFAAKTLLYIPQPMNHAVTTEGSEAWNVTLKFAYKPDGWDQFWRASQNAFAQIFSIDANALYEHFPPEDLSPLLF